jgi:hypothetical protein
VVQAAVSVSSIYRPAFTVMSGGWWMARVYVSSTVADLAEERRAVRDWLVAAGHLPVESYQPGTETVRASSLDDLNACDLYVLILGYRYGFVPANDNPEQLSITHLEFRQAAQSRVPRICLLRTSVPDISLSDLMDPVNSKRVSDFRDEVRREVRAAEFSDAAGLIAGMSAGLQQALQRRERPTRATTRSPGRARTTRGGLTTEGRKPAATSKRSRRIFLCYRREDSGPVVGRIYDRLVRDYGSENIFKDVDNIPFGVDFVEYLDLEVQKCDVLFAVIGRHWLDSSPDVMTRLEDPYDFVRIEIASALRRTIPIVPILVDGAQMPRAEQLPDDIKQLARRNGTEIRHDPDFHSDVTRLLSRLG